MRIRTTTIFLPITVLLASCASSPPPTLSCAPVSPSGVDNEIVWVNVIDDGEGGKMLGFVDPPGSNGCPAAQGKGCVRVKLGRSANFHFKLIGGKNQNCAGAGAGEYKWQGMWVSAVDKDFNDPGNVTDAIRCDFDTDANGWVQSPEFAGINMKVSDENSEEYVAYYQLVAESCTTGDTITSDPPIDNKGQPE